MKKLWFGLALCAMVVCAANASPITVIYDSIQGPPLYQDGSVGISTDNSAGPLYNSFSTGASPFYLTQADVILDVPDSPSGEIDVELYSTTNDPNANGADSVGSPIESLGEVADASTLTGGALYDLSLSVSPLLLDANTMYWIEISSPTSPSGADTNVGWAWTYTADGVGVSSSEWDDSQYGYYTQDTGPYEMSVAGYYASTPEPSTILLGAFGLGMLAAFRRRRTA